MLIYDKKDNKINVYNLIAKESEIRKYRKGVLKRKREELQAYSLITNRRSVVGEFANYGSISLNSIDFDYYDPLGPGDYSSLKVDDIKDSFIENYLCGDYDLLKPISVYTFNSQSQKEIIHRFLRTEEVIEYSNCGYLTWKFDGIIDLPKELYLLQLLILGKYDMLVNENIRKQLSLFDVEFMKSVNISDLRDILSTGLVQGSIASILEKTSVGEKILSKRK